MKLTIRRFIHSILVLIFCIAVLPTFASAAQINQLKGVRAWPSPDSTRVVLDFARKPDYDIQYLTHPDRILIDLRSTTDKVNLGKIKKSGPLVKDFRESASGKKGTYRLVIDLHNATKATVFSLPPEKPYGHRLVLDLPHAKKVTAVLKKQPVAVASGRDIIIAVDAGHGGEDPGASGLYTHEKKVTLAIAKRLQRKINNQKGMHAFLIRSGDYFVNLNKRTAIARKKKADFFVSIHADGFTTSQPHGASVWVLSNRRATSEMGRWMEKHEAHSELLGGVGNLMQDSSSVPFLTEMFLDMSMGNAMDVGYQVGGLVVSELKKVTPLHKYKPVHASLAVLKSPDIPSILVEAGFITNRAEEKLLNKGNHQEKIATAIFQGLYKHFTEVPPQNTLFAQKTRAIQHTVRSGESLSILAERYSVSRKKLQSYNNLHSSALHIGQTIKIPPNYQLVVKPEAAKQIVYVPQKATIHRVKRGQSLSVIAEKYGTTTAALKNYNKLRSTSLAIGQKIKIPGKLLASTNTQPVKRVTKPAKAVVHKVKSGESLSRIAAKYGTTTTVLKKHNKLRSTSLAIGQKIKIPGTLLASTNTQPVKRVTKPAKAVVHKVKSGESLSRIAAKYGTTTTVLQKHNKLRSTALAIGQKIKIPGTLLVSENARKKHDKVTKSTKTVVYKVKSGDSLSVIGKRYGKTSHELKAYNKLRSSKLVVGQKIKIPAADYQTPIKTFKLQPIVHLVAKGESLSGIASRFETTVSVLKKHNKLRSTSLRIGQKIKIPTSVAQVTKHKVRSGESLSVIANRYGTTANVLKAFNKLPSTSLLIGQVLTIPIT